MIDRLGIKGKIVAVVEHPDGSKSIYETHNIVTNDGDIFYAQKGAGETPTNAFANLVLGSTGSPTVGKASTYSSMTVISNTNKAPSTGYPKTNDQSADNSGKAADAVTYKYEYAAAAFSYASITEGVITVASPDGSSKVLCHFSFGGAFEKTANDTLTIYINHTMNGV